MFSALTLAGIAAQGSRLRFSRTVSRCWSEVGKSGWPPTALSEGQPVAIDRTKNRPRSFSGCSLRTSLSHTPARWWSSTKPGPPSLPRASVGGPLHDLNGSRLSAARPVRQRSTRSLRWMGHTCSRASEPRSGGASLSRKGLVLADGPPLRFPWLPFGL